MMAATAGLCCETPAAATSCGRREHGTVVGAAGRGGEHSPAEGLRRVQVVQDRSSKVVLRVRTLKSEWN